MTLVGVSTCFFYFVFLKKVPPRELKRVAKGTIKSIILNKGAIKDVNRSSEGRTLSKK